MSAASRACGRVRLAPPPPSPTALVCAPEPGEVTLHPTHGNSLSACSRRALHREGGEGGRLASAGVRLSHRGARTPDHKIVPQRCHGRAAAAAADARAEGGLGARSVLGRHGLQRGPVGVECWQRPKHALQCVRPRLHTAPRCPRLRSPAGGSHSPPAALGRCLGGGRGESIPCPRELWVVVVGSSPTGATALCDGGRLRRGLRGGVGGVQCSSTPRPSTATCRRGMSATSRAWPPVRAAPPPPSPATLLCRTDGEKSLATRSPQAVQEGGRGAVPPWGSNPRPQDLLPRAWGCPAPDCVLGRWVAARSVQQRHGLQRGPVGVER
eukprot:COSAG01_NODE_10254_length_2209_cov_2.554976_2_plen_325_part_00